MGKKVFSSIPTSKKKKKKSQQQQKKEEGIGEEEYGGKNSEMLDTSR